MDPVDEPRETSGATTLLLLGHVREHYGEDAVEEALRRADVPFSRDQLMRTGTWFGYGTRLRIYRSVADVVGRDHVMFDAGAEATVHVAHHALLLAVRALGGPQAAYRHLPRVAAKFTTVSTLVVHDVTPTTADMSFRLHDGYEFSHLDCLYVQGLIAAVPTAFGLALAHVEHPECQSEGHPACRYHVRWTRQVRWRPGRSRDQQSRLEIRSLRGQLEELQHAASDLVASEDVDEVVERIVERATAAVMAPSYLLVLQPDGDARPVLRSAGLSPHQAQELADRLVHGAPVGPEVVAVPVVSRRRHHGHLAVVHSPGQEGIGDERGLLAAYAQHAAAALDLLTALEETRDEYERTSSLLGLARDLAAAEGEDGVAEVVAAAAPRVVGSRCGTVFLWHPAQGRLTVAATAGHEPHQTAALHGASLTADEAPELIAMLAHHRPMVLRAGSAAPRVAALLHAAGADTAIFVPLLAGDTLVGAVTVGWAETPTDVDLDGEPARRATALAAQAAVALEKARLLATVRHQALHDALTGLPNRVLFTRTLDLALRNAQRDSGTAVLFCDLDRFKSVNDELGHAAGDELLRQVAARLGSVIRPGDTVGRLSGDEFAVVLSVADEDSAVAVARRVVEALDQPFRIEGRDLRSTVSVGVAVHLGTDGRGDRLLAASDAAMYEAKQRGRNQVVLAGDLPDRLVVPSLEAELGRAVEAEQLRLYYQPLVDVSGEEPVVVGAEALLRWAHPRLGLLAPGAFLPLAEESGLVTELDLWAVDAACAALAQWPTRDAAAGGDLHVAVNLAGATLVDPRLPGTVRAALARHGVAGHRLHLEVVESRSLQDLPGVVDHLAELRRMGLRIALDDFGTGFSTLAWLQALPVDQVKLDRSFVRRLPDDAPSLAVVRGVVALAAEMGVDVVAEGVELPEQLAAVRDAGCRHVQGYLLGRPAPILDVLGPTSVALDGPWPAVTGD